jgi:enterochelin esterase-like enzyme
MKMNSRTALIIIQMAIFILVAGCQAAEAQTPEPTRLVPTPDLAPTERKNNSTATVVPTITTCLESKGKVQVEQINSQSLSSPLEFTVYLPPCYDKSRQHPYPVLYMLHGQTNNNDQWPRLGLLDAADELIGTGEIAPLIIVMPYEITWSVGPEKSKFGETLLVDLFPYIEGTYNVCSKGQCRAIGGLSRGGNWAVNLGFAHPELFTAVGSHSAPLFFGEINRISSMFSGGETVDKLPRFYIDAGHKDENLAQVLAFVVLLKKYDVPYVYTQFTGYHSEDYWGAHVRDYLTWYSSQLLTTP